MAASGAPGEVVDAALGRVVAGDGGDGHDRVDGGHVDDGAPRAPASPGSGPPSAWPRPARTARMHMDKYRSIVVSLIRRPRASASPWFCATICHAPTCPHCAHACIRTFAVLIRPWPNNMGCCSNPQRGLSMQCG